MKVSSQWLSEWVSVSDTPEDLAERLTLAGLEVDSVAPVAPPFTGVVVARVEAVNPHPDADKLSVCQVDLGQSGGVTVFTTMFLRNHATP